MRRVVALLVALIGAAWFGMAARAADFPTRPVHIVVPYAPGGSTDILARLLGEHMQAGLGQPVVVDNKGGAGSILGTEYVSHAPPDGYTILLASSALTVNPVIYAKVGYDPARDLAPVGLLVTIPHVLVVRSSLPARSVAELIAGAKASGTALKYGSAGIGTSNQIEAALFGKLAGISTVHVPYRGVAPALTDLMAGRLDFIMGSAASLLPNARSGAVRALAVTARSRVPSLPDLPTIAESGVPGFETVDWLGLLVPAHTDPAIIERLRQGCADALADPRFRARLDELGFVAEVPSPERFQAMLANDVWAGSARDAGIRVEN